MPIESKSIIVNGIVQGVGFRPFIYKIAMENRIKGYVNNKSSGVYIDAEGSTEDIENFIYKIKSEFPPLARISQIEIYKSDYKGYKEFIITKSKEDNDVTISISPDYGTCDKCFEEILDRNNRRYRYPFTNCTDCGPRLSIIKRLPYDRISTTMNEFEMCPECKEEYLNPFNRRFHAQPNACPKCGPKISLLNNLGEEVNCQDKIREAVNLIRKGKILAVKGLGGYNLVCDGKNSSVIITLRIKKNRPKKPIAVMMKDIDTVKKYCVLNAKEEEVLKSNKKPIVILDRRKNFKLPIELGNDKTLGVMLPYTPLHYLLFEEDIEVLVVTSANLSGLPMIYKDEDALNNLKNIADYFLSHNRKIYNPIDDSVCIVMGNEERVIRLGRGYAPLVLDIKEGDNILATGSSFKNTIAFANNGMCLLSQYIGDMDNLDTYNSFCRCIEYYKKIYKIEYHKIIADLHPSFNYYSNLKKQNLELIKVQHHHSHIASCMAENNMNDTVIGIAFDGTGYGLDGNFWGSEFFICDYNDFKRVAHFNYFNIPGGESAIKNPWKIALSLLKKSYNSISFNKFKVFKDKPYKIISNMINSNLNSPLSCSIGRLFDGIAALLEFDNEVTFEGEAAIYLENIAEKNEKGFYKYDLDLINNIYVVNTDKIIRAIVEDLDSNIKKEIISMRFHNTVINITINLCEIIKGVYSINKIALSGGVFSNKILFENIYEKLEKEGFEVYTHKLVPNNDSGISLGQIAISRSKYKRGE